MIGLRGLRWRMPHGESPMGGGRRRRLATVLKPTHIAPRSALLTGPAVAAQHIEAHAGYGLPIQADAAPGCGSGRSGV